MRHRSRIVIALWMLGGCSGVGSLGDGTSISLGTFNRGALRQGRPLAPAGRGYRIPMLWQQRESNYGTDELIATLTRAARRVEREYPGGQLGVGDLAVRGGGPSVYHRSHNNGRDADLIWYAVDERGRPVPPADAMPRYDAVTLAAGPPRPDPRIQYGPFSPRRFDLARNWALIRALLVDPDSEIQYLFCHRGLKQRLLDHARTIGEEPALVERADALLHQPGDSLPHDDHLHVRIFCSADDRPYGCVDRGPVRWWKKRYKYLPPARSSELEELLALLRSNPFPDMRRFIP